MVNERGYLLTTDRYGAPFVIPVAQVDAWTTWCERQDRRYPLPYYALPVYPGTLYFDNPLVQH